MLFTGSAELTIDAKGRLAIPAKYRTLLDPGRDGAAWFCVAWPTGRLRLYTETRFQQLADQLDESIAPDEDTASVEVLLFAQAERLEMDSAGRVMLPKHHREMTGLSGEVAVIGAKNRLEVLGRAAWRKQLEDGFKQLPELVKRVQTK